MEAENKEKHPMFTDPSIQLNPYQEEELVKFLSWSHCFTNPFEPDFIGSIEDFAGFIAKCQATPNDLRHSGDIMGRIRLAMRNLQEEYERLLRIHEEFSYEKEEIKTLYSQEDAAKMLKQNLPQVYNRVMTKAPELEKAAQSESKVEVAA